MCFIRNFQQVVLVFFGFGHFICIDVLLVGKCQRLYEEMEFYMIVNEKNTKIKMRYYFIIFAPEILLKSLTNVCVCGNKEEQLLSFGFRSC